MRKLIVVVVMLLCGLSVALESSEKKDTVESLKRALVVPDADKVGVPWGTSKDEACHAYWRLSSYQDIRMRYKNAKLKDQAFAKALDERVRVAADKAWELLDAKIESGQALGCGGRELSDDFILGTALLAVPRKPSPARAAGKK